MNPSPRPDRPTTRRPTTALRVVLGLVGAAIVALGLNVALGGIATLGWQGPTDYFTVTSQPDFDVQDNHIRFLAGVWTGVGLVYLTATRWLHELRTTVALFSAIVVVGGLARLTSETPGVVLERGIIGSLVAELLLFPLLAWWTWTATRPGWCAQA